MILLAKRLANSTLWMLMTTGMPRALVSLTMISITSTEVLGSSDDVGSSARIKSGSCIKARAMPTR